MIKKHKMCIVYLSHIIGLTIGATTGLIFYHILKPKCKKNMIRNKVKKAFKTIENKIDV